MITLQILPYLTSRDTYEILKPALNAKFFEKIARGVIDLVHDYWRSHPLHTEMDVELFGQALRMRLKPTDEEEVVYATMLQCMKDNERDASTYDMLNLLNEQALAMNLGDLLNDFDKNPDLDLYSEATEILDRHGQLVKDTNDSAECVDTVDDILEDYKFGTCVRLYPDCLFNSMNDLKTGDQVIIAARPGKGKTSLCAYIAVNSVRDTHGITPRPVVWFNNEGKSKKVKGTCMRSALNMAFNQMVELPPGKANELYEDITRGRIRIFNVHGQNYKYIEKILKDTKPYMVFWDMLDNVKGVAAPNARKDEKLEELYQWAREQAVINDFVSLPTSQVSVEGADMEWVPDSCLKDSKTGKQGACDGIITMGYSPKPGFENSRYLYIPKSKFTQAPGAYQDCRTEVYFNQPVARFLMGDK